MSDYTQDLAKKLEAARKRLRDAREIKALKSSAPTLFEIIDTEISLLANRALAGDKPLGYEEYLSAHGEMKMAKRIRNLIDGKEMEEDQGPHPLRGLQQGRIRQVVEGR